MEAGTYVFNAGGGQRSMIVGIRNAELVEKLGRMNMAYFDRSRLIVSRAEETFDNETGAALLREWGVPENYIARCFVTLDYCEGG